MPPIATVPGRHSIGVELVSDGPQGVAVEPQPADALDDGLRYEDGPTQLDARLLGLRESFRRVLADGRVTGHVVPATYPGPLLPADAPKITDWMQAWGSLVGLRFRWSQP